MADEKTDGPAFPRTDSETNYGAEGMSLRDWFAGKALQGILASPRAVVVDGKPPKSPRDWATIAYAVADAMFAERENAGGE